MAAKRPVKSNRSIHHASKEWIRNNPESFLGYAGKWVVVGASGIEISDTDEERLRARALEMGWTNPFVQLVPGGDA